VLENFKFLDDTEETLISALQELDHDADGFISKEELGQYLSTMAEVFSPEELAEFMEIVGDDEGLVNIEKMAKVLVPKLSAGNDLTELIKKEE